MATKEETDRAITAVDKGFASKEQKEIAARAARQAGSTGNAARSAFRGK